MCTARRRNGQPCRGAALKGSDKCRHHAGITVAENRLKTLGILGNNLPNVAHRVLGNTLGLVEMTDGQIKTAKLVMDAALDARAVGELERLTDVEGERIEAAFTLACERAGLDPETIDHLALEFAAALDEQGEGDYP